MAKTALDKIAELKAKQAEEIKKIAADAIDELKAEFAKYQEALEKAQRQMEDVDAQIIELGGASLLGGKKKGKKGGGGKAKESKPFTATAAQVKKFIDENAGDEGVATRALTAQFGKPTEGWEVWHSENKTAKSNGKSGSAGRWLKMK